MQQKPTHIIVTITIAIAALIVGAGLGWLLRNQMLVKQTPQPDTSNLQLTKSQAYEEKVKEANAAITAGETQKAIDAFKAAREQCADKACEQSTDDTIKELTAIRKQEQDPNSKLYRESSPKVEPAQ